MSEKLVTLSDVAAAFERLVGHVLNAPCDPEYARVIHMAGDDILAILRGEWDLDAEPLLADEEVDGGPF